MEKLPENEAEELEIRKRTITEEVRHLSDAELDQLAEEAFEKAEAMQRDGKLDAEYRSVRFRATILNDILTDRLLKHKT